MQLAERKVEHTIVANLAKFVSKLGKQFSHTSFYLSLDFIIQSSSQNKQECVERESKRVWKLLPENYAEQKKG